MRCERFSFLIALQREERASSLQPLRPPPSSAKSSRSLSLIQGSGVAAPSSLGHFFTASAFHCCVLALSKRVFSSGGRSRGAPPGPETAPPPRNVRRASAWEGCFCFQQSSGVQAEPSGCFFFTRRHRQGGVKALGWNRLDCSLSGWDEGQNAGMERVFSGSREKYSVVLPCCSS